MLQFQMTVESILTISVLDSILALLLCLLFRSHKVAGKIGPGCMLAVLLAVVVRTSFPIEFWYTKAVFVEDILLGLIRVLSYPVWSFGSFELLIKHCLVFIWLLGMVVVLRLWQRSYHNYARYLAVCPELSWEKLSRQYSLKKEDYKGIEQVKIVTCGSAGFPHVFGFKTKYLVLPNIPFQGQQLHYILLHELMHVQKRDIIWKMLIDVLCVGFWWNPVFRYLRKELNELLEMRNDKQLTENFVKEEKACYMNCLMNMAEWFVQKEEPFSLAFGRGDLKDLERRIRMLADSRKTHRFSQVIAATLVGLVLLLNSAVVFAPAISLEKARKETGIDEIEDVEPVTKDNTFIIEKDGRFDIYVDGEYLHTVEDIDYFGNEVNVYKSLEEMKEEQGR